MRRGSNLKGIQQKAKLLPALLLADTNVSQHHLLDVMLVNAQTAT